MKNLELSISDMNFESLSKEELENIEGGHPILIAIGIGYALYEAGKAAGEFTYWMTH